MEKYNSPTTNKLIERIKASKKTQMEIAAGTGLSKSNIGRIVRREVFPACDTHDKIVDFLEKLDSKEQAKNLSNAWFGKQKE